MLYSRLQGDLVREQQLVQTNKDFIMLSNKLDAWMAKIDDLADDDEYGPENGLATIERKLDTLTAEYDGGLAEHEAMLARCASLQEQLRQGNHQDSTTALDNFSNLSAKFEKVKVALYNIGPISPMQ